MMYKIPDNKKDELRKPIGKLVKEIDSIEGKIVSIGDAVTTYLIKKDIKPDIAVVDYKIQRKKYNGKYYAEKVIKVKNPPGCISRQLWNAIATAYAENKKTLIEVDGEEDLAALPAIYLAPENTTVIYGLRNKGMVVVEVGKEERRMVKKFLNGLEG